MINRIIVTMLLSDVVHCWTCLALRVRITGDSNVLIITTRESSSELKNLLADKFTERPSRGSSWTALSLPCAGCYVPPVGPGSAGPYKWGSLSVYKRSACVEWPRCCLDEGGSVGPRPQIARSRCAEATLTSQWICNQTRLHMLGPLGINDTDILI